MTEKLFETALSLSTPWYVAGAEFDEEARRLTIRIDSHVGQPVRGGWGGRGGIRCTNVLRSKPCLGANAPN
jgi:hypothetical protein